MSSLYFRKGEKRKRLSSRREKLLGVTCPSHKLFFDRVERVAPGHVWCVVCDRVVDISDTHKHHVMPLWAGGTNAKWNILRICEDCHALDMYPHLAGKLLERLTITRWYMLAEYGILHALQYPELRLRIAEEFNSHGGFSSTTARRINHQCLMVGIEEMKRLLKEAADA